MPASHPALGHPFLTPWYEWAIWLGVPERKIRLFLVEQLSQYPVLDFGSGTGSFLELVREKAPGKTIRGLDTDSYMVKVSRRKKLPIDFYTEGNLPYRNESFGTVTSTWVFQHFSEEEALFYLKEVRRILTPEGVFWMGDWGPSSSRIQETLSRIVHWLDPTQNGFGPAGRWPELLQKSGFSRVTMEYRINTRLGTFYYWKCEN